MRIIDKRQVLDLINNYGLVPDDKCILVNKENGGTKDLISYKVLERLDTLKNPIFKTDDDGALKIVTLDVHYGYAQNNLDTGYLIRVLLYRQGQKRMQYNLLSNGVGAPTRKNCILKHY